ncbi:Uncharacterised protein [Burkholderia pseudomallei]|nr:Uncharacterised protein [Burkholderia pseudomallei]CAJ7637492.1 Uncharacterised protein [Burkholderia pseudomallei]CAJ9176891.1 Uncharacterised protein [Burkholderia pseudomallei]
MRGRHTGAGTACERWRHMVTGRPIGGNRTASSVAAVIARPRAGLTIVRVRCDSGTRKNAKRGNRAAKAHSYEP